MTYSSLKMVQSSRSRRKTCWISMSSNGWKSQGGLQEGILLCRLRWHPGHSAVVSAPWQQGLVWCFSSGEMQVFLIFLCSCVTAVRNHICEVVPHGGLSTAQEERCRLVPALQDVLVFFPYLCSHLSCSSQCFPWLFLLFALSGRELSGPRAWLALVFV